MNEDRSAHHISPSDPASFWKLLTATVALGVIAALGWLYLGANLGPGEMAPKPAMFDNGIETLEEAKSVAGTDGLVFAFATADWCPPCQRYKRTALVDPAVEAWVRAHATPVYIDADHNPADARTLDVSGIPQTTLLTADGKVLMREVGALSAQQLLAALRGAVKAR